MARYISTKRKTGQNGEFEMRRRDNAIKERVHKVFLHQEFKSGGSELRVVSWIVNGQDMGARIERREYYVKGEDLTRINGRAKGFSIEDLIFMRDNMDEIIDLMRRVGKEKMTEGEDMPDESECF